MPGGPGELTEAHIIEAGGWHPRYARVLAVTTDGDYGLAIVDGNGDGAELESELWLWDEDDDRWVPGSSSGTGPLDHLGSVDSAGQLEDAQYAYGRVPGRRSVTISFNGRQYEVPVGREGVWAFMKPSIPPFIAPPALAP